MKNHKSFTLFGFFVWGIGCLYFFYEYFLRVFLGTIATDVMRDLHIQAEQFAILGGAYYLTYSIMQTPVGILLDRYGVKLLLTLACVTCNVGVFLFALANNFWFAMMGRFLIGLGSSFAFVSLLVLALNWFPREHFGLMAGITQGLGAIGPFLAGAPLAHALKVFNNNWRLILTAIGFFGVTLNILILSFVKTAPKNQSRQVIFLSHTEPLLSKLKELLKNSQVWFTMLFASSVYCSVPLMGAYWGTTFLESKGIERATAALVVSMMWIGLSSSSLAIGKLSDLMKRRKTPLQFCSLIGFTVSIVIILWDTTSVFALSIFFFLLGTSAGAQSLSFATISEHVPKKFHATALGLNNTAVMFNGFLIPYIASSFIQAAAKSPDTTQYSFATFQVGLSIMPLFFALAFLFSLFGIKETYCRQQHEIFTLNP